MCSEALRSTQKNLRRKDASLPRGAQLGPLYTRDARNIQVCKYEVRHVNFRGADRVIKPKMAQGPPSVGTNNSGVTNLLPELLLGLLGHTGGAFVCENEGGRAPSEAGMPKLSNTVDWITLPER